MVRSEHEKLTTVMDAFGVDELDALVTRIISSGELGRSRNYAELLKFLVACTRAGRSPKEIEIAIDVLGRGEDFDVAADSTVRVYIHQLRKKLDNYYAKYEGDAAYRLVIPKGQYSAAAQKRAGPPVAELNTAEKRLSTGGLGKLLGQRLSMNTALLVLAILLLSANLITMISRDGLSSATPASALNAVAMHPVWREIMDDNEPITLVMGDYYIFGEVNADGNVARMVREFNVNSSDDLEDLRFSEIEKAEGYLDLDLSYMPEGSAFALAKVVPILEQSGKSVTVSMMSDLTMADIRSSHIVYIGYISALEKLSKLAFAASGLALGRSYDELVNIDTMEYYTSDAGLPEQGQAFRDFGLFSTFPGSSDTQVVVISGMRDAGLMHTAQALSSYSALTEIEQSLVSSAVPEEASNGKRGEVEEQNFEVLYEVFGMDRMNFDSRLIYLNQLDAELIWGNTIGSAF